MSEFKPADIVRLKGGTDEWKFVKYDHMYYDQTQIAGRIKNNCMEIIITLDRLEFVRRPKTAAFVTTVVQSEHEVLFGMIESQALWPFVDKRVRIEVIDE